MRKWLAIAICVFIAIWGITPTYLTIQTALVGHFKFSNPLLLLQQFTLTNWKLLPWHWLAHWLKNSIVVCGLSALLITGLNLMGGYGFAKYNFPGKEQLFWFLLISMMIPGAAIFLPRFLVTKNLGLFDTYWGMILPLYSGAAGIFLARQYYRSLSDDTLDAARLDGASEIQLFRYIVLPLSTSLAIFFFLGAFMGQWSNFMWQYLITKGTDLRTFAVGAGLFIMGGDVTAHMSIGDPEWLRRAGGTLEGLHAALSVLQALPMIVFYAIGQRFVIESLKFGVIQE